MDLNRHQLTITWVSSIEKECYKPSVHVSVNLLDGVWPPSWAILSSPLPLCMCPWENWLMGFLVFLIWGSACICIPIWVFGAPHNCIICFAWQSFNFGCQRSHYTCKLKYNRTHTLGLSLISSIVPYSEKQQMTKRTTSKLINSTFFHCKAFSVVTY